MPSRLDGGAMMQTHVDHMKGPSDGTRKPLGSERGVALVMVLVLSAIGLIVMTTVLYVLLIGTQMSGSEKRYRTAHEAALGGIDILRPIIQAQAAITIPGVLITYQGTQFTDKIAASSLAGFAANQIDVEINPLIPATYDLYIDLGNPVYRVYAKMTQKQQGNTNKGYKQVRIKTGVVPADPGMGEIHFTYYTFNILAQKLINPNERVRMDLVHIF
jgi:hypothetical protein